MQVLEKLIDYILVLNPTIHSFSLIFIFFFPSFRCNIELSPVRKVLSLCLFASLTFGSEFHKPPHLYLAVSPEDTGQIMSTNGSLCVR